MQKLDAESKPVGANCVRPHFEEITVKNQKGITLIALIITIIVMLILVGVTINVALNGALFQKTEKATYQTEVALVKEKLEIQKAIAIADNKGEPLDDYSIITIDMTDLEEKIKDKYENKIVLDIDGNICYNSENVTNAEERIWLQEIGISEKIINITTNPWIQRGLGNTVIYDKKYSGTINYNDQELVYAFIAKSNGDLELTVEGNILAATSEMIDAEMLEEFPDIKVELNCVSLPQGDPDFYIIDQNTIEVRYKRSTNAPLITLTIEE